MNWRDRATARGGPAARGCRPLQSWPRVLAVLSERDLELVRQATERADGIGDVAGHSVAAAAYDDRGQLVTGVNASHFTGGPCAELALLGRAADLHRPVRLDVVVAVRANAGVIPPCGRCRQVLFDYHPDTRAIVRTKTGLTALPITELLPFPFDWRAYGPDAGGPPLHLHAEHLAAVREGDKTSAIRVHDPVQPGPARLVFEHPDGTSTTVDAVVTEVRHKQVRELADREAHRDGFPDRAALLRALREQHPGLGDAARVDIVEFRAIG